MKLAVPIILFILLINTFYSRAQMEAAVWPVDSGMQINFQSGKFEYLDFDGSPNVNATICDKYGNLLIMTDGETIWNGRNEVLINGSSLIEEGYFNTLENEKPIFVPYPGKEGYYILFYSYGRTVQKEIIKYTLAGSPQELWFEHTGEFYDTYGDIKLVYAVIDINADEGRGAVVSKQNFMLTNFGDLSISGYCDNSYYWMAISYDEPVKVRRSNVIKTQMLFYKIDENGVNAKPKVTFFDFGNIEHLKFSPNGDKLYFSYGDDRYAPDRIGILHDFNFLKGELYNYRVTGGVNTEYFCAEFSPDSRLLYLIIETSIVQYDARYTINKYLKESVDTIFNYPTGFELYNFQLAPNGKIHILHYSNYDKKYGNGWINYPNLKGKECKLRLRSSFFNSNKLIEIPDFVTSFFRDKTLDDIDFQYADAGPDKRVCYSSKVQIGAGDFYPDDIYQWFPDRYIKHPFSSQDTFFSPGLLDTTRVIRTLRTSDGNCWIDFDDMEVTIYPPYLGPDFDGSWTVCPFAKEVEYWVVQDSSDQNIYSWLVEGGEIVGNNIVDKVKINWDTINPEAIVKVKTISDIGCISRYTKLPVAITPELQPEIPEGFDVICIADAYDISYKTKNTNGSSYEWIVDGGIITDGQGSNEIKVDWKYAGQNKIFVREYNESNNYSCYGESEPLTVRVINDSIQIELSHLSFTTDNRLEVYYFADKPSLSYYTLIQHTEEANTGFKEDVFPLTSGPNDHYVYWANPEESGSQIISMELITRCDEIFHSNQQQSIVLSGEIYPEETNISIQWNLNSFWDTDQIKHEIWHSVNGKNNWELIASLDRQTTFEFEYQNNSLKHYIRVKEINVNKNVETWSNTIDFQVTEMLKIPDVFTPNGDGYNDTWEIWNLNSFIFKSLTVYTKSGEIIYKCRNGFIPWNGMVNGKVFQGTYLYELTFENLGTRYGQITVLQ